MFRTKKRGGKGNGNQVKAEGEARGERWAPAGGLRRPCGGAGKASRGLGTNGPTPSKPSLALASIFTDCREKSYPPLEQELSRPQTHPLPMFSPQSKGDATRPLPSREKSARPPETRRRSSVAPKGYKVAFSIGYLTCQSTFISRGGIGFPRFLRSYWLPNAKDLSSCERQMGTKSEALYRVRMPKLRPLEAEKEGGRGIKGWKEKHQRTD